MKLQGRRQSQNTETERNRPQKDDRFAIRTYDSENTVNKFNTGDLSKQAGSMAMDKPLEKAVKKGQWLGRTRMAGVYANQDEYGTSYDRPGNFTEHVNKSYKSKPQ